MQVKFTTKPARRMQPVDLGTGKVYTPIRDEFGSIDYELSYNSSFIGFAASPNAARERLNEAAYDAERGLPVEASAEYDLEADATEQAAEVAAVAVGGINIIPATLTDGTPIEDVLEHNGERAGVLVVKWNNFHISAEHTGLVGFEDRQAYGHRLSTSLSGDLTHEGIARLRLLATSGVLTELLGIATAHPAPDMSTHERDAEEAEFVTPIAVDTTLQVCDDGILANHPRTIVTRSL